MLCSLMRLITWNQKILQISDRKEFCQGVYKNTHTGTYKESSETL